MISEEANSPNIDPAMASLFEYKLTKGDQKRSEIIIATIDCLYDFGIEKTSFGSIADKLGIQKSHVNYYFKSKDDIYFEIYRYIAGTYQSFTLRELPKAKSKKDELNKFVDAYFKWCEANEKQLNAMFLLYYFCFHKPEFRDINQQIRVGGVSRISHILKQAYNLTPKKSLTVARGIQAILASTAVDIYTFKKEDKNQEAKEQEARKLIRLLLK